MARSYTSIISYSYYNVPFVLAERSEFREISARNFLACLDRTIGHRIKYVSVTGLSGLASRPLCVGAESTISAECARIDTRREFVYRIPRGPSSRLIPLVNRRLFRKADFWLYTMIFLRFPPLPCFDESRLANYSSKLRRRIMVETISLVWFRTIE